MTTITTIIPQHQISSLWQYVGPKVGQILEESGSPSDDVYAGLRTGHYTLWMVYSDEGDVFGFAITHPYVNGDEAGLNVYVTYSEDGAALRDALECIESHARQLGLNKLIFRTAHDPKVFERWARPLGFRPALTEFQLEL